MCNSKQVNTEAKTDQGISIKISNSTNVKVTSLEDLKEHHSAHFTDIKILISGVLIIILTLILIGLAIYCFKCIKRRNEAYIQRRANSIIRKYRSDV